MRVNKSSDESPDVRARLVARDFKPKGSSTSVELFAAMPPLSAKKLLFRQAAREGREWRKGQWKGKKILLIDVKKAHLNSKVPEDVDVYVQLPDGTVRRLRRWLYGMRLAAQAWEKDFTQRLEEVGFRRGKSCPTVFFREKTGCRCVVHGDDFTFLSLSDEIENIVRDMQRWYDIKVRGVLGGESGDDEEATILGRTLRWKSGSRHIEYEADAKYAKQIIKETGLNEES